MERVIAVIDMKSFYASCECACRHLDIFKTPLVCCDPNRGGSSIVMSATPYLKRKYAIPNVCRKKDLPNVKGMIYAVPRMSYYLTMSAEVNRIYLEYVAEEDLHIYSVDESFLNLGPYLSLYGKSAEEIVQEIQEKIRKRLGLFPTAGIGPNPFLAKVCLDLEGKKKAPYFARWDQEDIQKKLWPISDLSSIWGIGSRTAAHLKRIGIHSMRELALAPTALLQKEFGVIGLQLRNLANGIDESDIQEKYVPEENSLSLGQTLKRPYNIEDLTLILQEMCDELSLRLRKHRCLANKVSFWCSNELGGVFQKQVSLDVGCDDTPSLYRALLYLIGFLPEGIRTRNVGIAFGKLERSSMEQISLFEDEHEKKESKRLDMALDKIRTLFGKSSVLRGTSLLEASTAKFRNQMIGGHRR